MKNNQKKLLDDLYSFSNPWFQKIYSPYWSKIYAYEVRRVALAIIENTYMHYPQFFDSPINDECGGDCSIYATRFEVSIDDDENSPNGNKCSPDSKKVIPLLVCEINYDCESIEFGCSAVVAGSVKRNFKKKNTELFVGVGLEVELGAVKAGGKFGGSITVGDDNKVDGGLKVSVSGTIPKPIGAKGAEIELNLTVMEGLNTEYKRLENPF